MATRIFFFVALPLAILFASYLMTNVAWEWIERATTPDPVITVAAAPRLGSEEANAQVVRDRLVLPNDEQLALLASAPTIDRETFPLEVRKVVIDAGHGGDNLGTEAPNGLVEKEIALDISTRLKELLEAASYGVVMTREQDEFISLEQRATMANDLSGDLFISVHLNWIETRQVRGVETYYLGPTNDPYLQELAARENRDSGYSIADFRSMLERVYADVRQGESEKLAASVQRSLYNALRKVNPSLDDRGVKKAPFIVLTGTEMPAILAEVSCLSNEREARLLLAPEYRQFIAEALFAGIHSYARDVSGADTVGS